MWRRGEDKKAVGSPPPPQPTPESRGEERRAASRPRSTHTGRQGEKRGGGWKKGEWSAGLGVRAAEKRAPLPLDASLLEARGRQVPARRLPACPPASLRGVCAAERACVSGRGRAATRTAPGAPAAPRVRPGLTGARGGRWLARAPSSPPIPGACPNFLIQGTNLPPQQLCAPYSHYSICPTRCCSQQSRQPRSPLMQLSPLLPLPSQERGMHGMQRSPGEGIAASWGWGQ